MRALFVAGTVRQGIRQGISKAEIASDLIIDCVPKVYRDRSHAPLGERAIRRMARGVLKAQILDEAPQPSARPLKGGEGRHGLRRRGGRKKKIGNRKLQGI